MPSKKAKRSTLVVKPATRKPKSADVTGAEIKDNARTTSRQSKAVAPPETLLTATVAKKPKRSGSKKAANPLSYPVVAVGASAGGLEAFTQLLKALPVNTGMAFVLIQHLDPQHESRLTELLARTTKMPVTEVKNGMMVEPDHVYVIPPNADMAILHGALQLMPRRECQGQYLPIDFFFRSLAADQQSQAIGVILSGTASDGAQGLKAIKSEGGVTFAQEAASAKYDGMPRAAVAAGAVDFILSPQEIAQELARLGRDPYILRTVAVKLEDLLPETTDALNKIFVLLRGATGVDFTYYKHPTIKRRIARRMVLHRLESLEFYVRYLRENPAEVQALFHEILINVTSFFREPEAFKALQEKVFQSLFKDRQPAVPIRVWVPGCATGEEAYSLAICLLEFVSERTGDFPIQIFATDISEAALEKARVGRYPENIAQEVSPERLRRFFVKVEGGYQISKSIRDLCVFAKQNMMQDPPFSRMDLISCRNVLIYLGPVLQKKVIPIFHYALNPGGFLMLGGSETIGGFPDLFTQTDRKSRIYAKKMTRTRLDYRISAVQHLMGKTDADRIRDPEVYRAFDVRKEADSILLDQYAPAGVLVNDELEILQFRGHAGAFLESPPGEATHNLLKMAREGLLVDLHAGIYEARKKNILVLKEGLRVKVNGVETLVNLKITPIIASLTERFFLILFEEVLPTSYLKATKPGKVKPYPNQAGRESEFLLLQDELTTTRKYLQSIIEDQEETNAELRSANEEILSANEELQSTNEELETTKEELQATNEELTTVNEELYGRNHELSRLNDDLNNLLSSINLPLIIVGADLRLRRFTTLAEKVMNVIPGDVGRPFSDLKPNLQLVDLEAQIQQVIDTVTVTEKEVQDREGHWYSIRMRPYHTTDNRIDGVIIVLVDIDVSKQSQRQIQQEKDFSAAIVDTVREPLLVLNGDLSIHSANHSFYQTFQSKPADTVGRRIYDLGNGQWNIPSLRSLLEELLPRKKAFNDFFVEHNFPDIGRKKMILNARQILRTENQPELILLAMEEMPHA